MKKWKHTVAGMAALGLCSAMLFTPMASPVNVKAEGVQEEAANGTDGQEADASAVQTTASASSQGALTASQGALTTGQDALTTGQDTPAGQNESGTDEVSGPASQKISVKVSKKTYTSNQFKASKKTFKIGASAQTDLSYEVTEGKKYVSVNQNGLVTIKRWTPKGTYKIAVTAEASDDYEEAESVVTIQVQEPKNAALSKLKMGWDLENFKTVAYSTAYGAVDDAGGYKNIIKNGSIKLKNFKKSKVSNGKKYQVSYTLQYTHPANFSQSEIEQIVRFGGESEGVWGSPCYMAILDYQTGENLTRDNSYGVKVSTDKWRGEGTNKYTANSGWFSENAISEIKVTVTYPVGYQDLCIVAGGLADRAGLKGNAAFTFHQKNFKIGADILYGSSKKICHGMRVK